MEQFDLFCGHKVISTFVYCDLDLKNQKDSSSHHGQHLCQVWSKYNEQFDLYCVHKVTSTFAYFNLDLWTKKILGFILPSWLTSAKFVEVSHNGLVFIMFTMSKYDWLTDGQNYRSLLDPLHNMLHKDKQN